MLVSSRSAAHRCYSSDNDAQDLKLPQDSSQGKILAIYARLYFFVTHSNHYLSSNLY